MTEILEPKRLGIFVMYDKEGIVDEYIIFLLRSLKLYLSGLVIVCNGGVQREERIKLERFADRIVMRENIGCDVMAWKAILCDLIERREIAKYDEILLCNDSFYGPIFPWEEMFQKMNHEDIDFWGITRHPKSYEMVRGDIPEHLQSFFMVLKKRLFCSAEFSHYWEEIDLKESSLLSAILVHELRFTEHFASMGFRWKAYIEPFELERENQADLNYNEYYLSPLELVKNHRCPIIKKKALTDKNLQFVAGEEPKLLLAFIEEKSDYPTSMIWKHLIRTVPKEMLYDAFHMHYVVPETNPALYGGEAQKICIGIYVKEKPKREYIIHRCKSIPIDMEILEKPSDFELLFTGQKYDMVGLLDLTDDDSLTQLERLFKIEDLMENMLECWEYAAYLFRTEPYLGIIYPLVRSLEENIDSDRFSKKSYWCRGNFFIKKNAFLYGTICTNRGVAERLCSYDAQFSTLGRYGELPDIFNRKDVLQKPELMEYVQVRDGFYIYGTGIYGKRLYKLLAEMKKSVIAFVVSDGQPMDMVEQVPVISFRELCHCRRQDSGLIIALSKKIQLEVKDSIDQSGMKDIYYL